MEKTIIKVGDFLFKKIDIDKIAVYNKFSFGKKGFKYFTGYKDAKKIRPLCIFLPKMSTYRRDLKPKMCLFG